MVRSRTSVVLHRGSPLTLSSGCYPAAPRGTYAKPTEVFRRFSCDRGFEQLRGRRSRLEPTALLSPAPPDSCLPRSLRNDTEDTVDHNAAPRCTRLRLGRLSVPQGATSLPRTRSRRLRSSSAQLRIMRSAAARLVTLLDRCPYRWGSTFPSTTRARIVFDAESQSSR
jgi:hypothetical protein